MYSGGVCSVLAACNGIQLLSGAEAAPSACSLWTGNSHPLPSCWCPLLTHPAHSWAVWHPCEISQHFLNVNGKLLLLNRKGWNNSLWATIYGTESVQREMGSWHCCWQPWWCCCWNLQGTPQPRDSQFLQLLVLSRPVSCSL